MLGGLFPLPGFGDLQAQVESNRDQWRAYKGGPAEAEIPNEWATNTAETDFQNFLEMMVIQKPFRPDQMIRSGNKFIETVLGGTWPNLPPTRKRWRTSSSTNLTRPFPYCWHPRRATTHRSRWTGWPERSS